MSRVLSLSTVYSWLNGECTILVTFPSVAQLLPPMPDAVFSFVIGELEKRQIICRVGGLIRFTNENVRWQHYPSFLTGVASPCLSLHEAFFLAAVLC